MRGDRITGTFAVLFAVGFGSLILLLVFVVACASFFGMGDQQVPGFVLPWLGASFIAAIIGGLGFAATGGLQ